MSKALYEEFLRPLLLVGLFAPAEELSAAAVLETFYFYSALPPLHWLFAPTILFSMWQVLSGQC